MPNERRTELEAPIQTDRDGQRGHDLKAFGIYAYCLVCWGMWLTAQWHWILTTVCRGPGAAHHQPPLGCRCAECLVDCEEANALTRWGER